MNIINLGTNIKWQETDKRDVPDVRFKIINESLFQPGLLLEIGCAAANFYKFFSMSNRYNIKYVGVDINLKQIIKAKKLYPNGNFIHGDILHMSELLKNCNSIVSFQVFEHIKNDLEMFDEIQAGKNMIFSVPNFPYRSNKEDGHKRYYDLDGWIKRYEPFIDFSEAWIIKHYKKNRKIFVFHGVSK